MKRWLECRRGAVGAGVFGGPQNAPGGAYDFANLTTDNVERIEVVRGPASVLYGSDAMTGVVQIFTRDGRGPARGTVGWSGGGGAPPPPRAAPARGGGGGGGRPGAAARGGRGGWGGRRGESTTPP